MEARKQVNPETSSDENDFQEQTKEDKGTNSTATKRSYECTFCKRGFTNAQALGGHMNIHRKDRAKDKHPLGFLAPTKVINNEEYINPSYLPAISSEYGRYYPIFEPQRTHHSYYQQFGSNPRQQPGYDHGNDFHVRSPQPLSVKEDLWGANLSLQIGNAATENSQLNPGISTEDELDLELRLGHDP
ncbi:hypothetical protein K2173_021548 [Erythroxylum novogranatense]|uniref:C2H2-type domain-containing protein n=1 Tax=Erythroxylum novogranatense TaxID=1862640 RepID=A0AAV8TQ63_9ROSI|nr:hypothetical protein K2173_021548 [Erythroxylum novogranatense]